MSMKDTLQAAKEILAKFPDHMFICWHGVMYSVADKLSRCDMTSLLVLRDDRFIRTVPVLTTNEQNEGQLTYWLDETVVKIKNNVRNRQGKRVVLSDLSEGETFVTVTIQKNLRVGNDREDFRLSRQQDKLSYYHLQELVDQITGSELPEHLQKVEEPEWWITSTRFPPDFRLRQNGEAVAFAQTLKGFRKDAAPEIGFKDALAYSENFAIMGVDREGAPRYAMPFAYVHGRGVIGAKTESIGKWFAVPKTWSLVEHHFAIRSKRNKK